MPSYWINSMPLTGNPSGTIVNQFIPKADGTLIALAQLLGNGSYPGVFFQFNSAGYLTNSIEFDGSNCSRLTCGYVESDGSILLGTSDTGTTPAGRIGKLNSNLTLATTPQKTVGLTASTYRALVSKIDKASDENYLVCLSNNGQNIGVVKYDTIFSNTFVWSYTPTEAGYYTGMVQDSSGNIYVHGAATISAVSRSVLTKLNSSGVEQWTRTQTPSSGAVSGFNTGEISTTLCKDSSDNLYITGCSESNTRCFIASYDTSGVIRWQRQFVVSNITGRMPAIASDGTYIYVAVWNANNSFIIAKYNSSGVLQWQRSFIPVSPPSTAYVSPLAALNTMDNGQSLIIGLTTILDNARRITFAKLPSDGTLTGTYGGYVYASSSVTEQAGTLTSASATMTAGGSAFSTAAGITRVKVLGGLTNVS